MKKITESQMIGDQGIALIKTRVLGMGQLWYETGATEAGIDGTIEFRDGRTGIATNQIVQVQSRATSTDFTAETETSFEYLCDERDLAYWLGGNAPVILVRSRPKTDEAYWVSIKDYFRDPARIAARRIVFDKDRDRFDSSARDELVKLAVPRGSGIYIAPPPKRETIVSNLLDVVGYPKSIYVAETEFRLGRALGAALRLDDPYPPREWMLRHGQLYSIHDLREEPWSSVCEVGTVERFDAEEWAQSDDRDRLNEFAQLLYACLSQRVGRDLRYVASEKLFIAKATKELRPRRLYSSARRRRGRMIFCSYPSKKNAGQVGFCKHWAFRAHFQRFDGMWFLEITPTYHYTIDGYRESNFAADYLAHQKKLDNNDAVRRQVQMWAGYLRGGHDDLFAERHEHLEFGELATFELPAGVNDRVWLANTRKSKEKKEPPQGQRLFAA
jgi:Domain of unknown function (DUF4365)